VLDAPLNEPAALDAVVDLALQRRLTCLGLYACGLSPASAPALARLVGGSALRSVVFFGERTRLLDEPAAVLLGNALRANTTLTSLAVQFVDLFNDTVAAAALLGALTAHPTLQKLDLTRNNSEDEHLAPADALTAAGAALGALVAANAPALRELNLNSCHLTDAGLGALLDALPANRHLRVLNCRHNLLSEAFMRERLLPAVRANPWLEAKQ
jgi:Ran GTPase-activating protein (RanGAP) involved in mRNA processing and transport